MGEKSTVFYIGWKMIAPLEKGWYTGTEKDTEGDNL